MFSRYIRSFGADCSTNAHHQMGARYSSFPIALVASTSIDDSNLIPRQWLNLGLSRYRWLQLRRINRCKAFSAPVGPNTLTGAPSRTAEPAQNPATNRYSRSEATISSFTKKNQCPVPTPRFQRDCGQRGFQARLPAHSSAWARSVASHPLREPQLRKRSSFIFNQAPDDTVGRQSHHSPTSDQRHQHLGRCLISVATAIFKGTNRTSIEPPLLPAQRC